MNFFYTRLFVLSAMLLPVLAGCESYVQPLGATNPTIPDNKARSGLSSSSVRSWWRA